MEQDIPCCSLYCCVVGVLALKQLDDWSMDTLNVVLLNNPLQRIETILDGVCVYGGKV